MCKSFLQHQGTYYSPSDAGSGVVISVFDTQQMVVKRGKRRHKHRARTMTYDDNRHADRMKLRRVKVVDYKFPLCSEDDFEEERPKRKNREQGRGDRPSVLRGGLEEVELP
ncbi:hypothetical protein BC936DRAFT_141242 [Jimgerdemannia flammicorona]|uniref:Uncharacterized protein n=1 Tax=Jimgerdemannia flammicorona TaxID=994334 RepID=A0A433DML8_9FUNG|nr:hypothetical protein BC936DRAFT_141242 [Jimgerdemannia flammicorona]